MYKEKTERCTLYIVDLCHLVIMVSTFGESERLNNNQYKILLYGWLISCAVIGQFQVRK